MTKKCCVCGCEFVPRQRNYVTCGDPDCRRIQHLGYMSEYGKKHRKEHREYNRAWMQRKRMEQKTEDEEKRIRREHGGEGYAERQMQKTLALAGKIQL